MSIQSFLIPVSELGFNILYPVTRVQMQNIMRNSEHLYAYRGDGLSLSSLKIHENSNSPYFTFQKHSGCDKMLFLLVWSPVDIHSGGGTMDVKLQSITGATTYETWTLDLIQDENLIVPDTDKYFLKYHVFDISSVTTHGRVKIEKSYSNSGDWFGMSGLQYNNNHRITWVKFEDISGGGNIHDAGLKNIRTELINTKSRLRNFGCLDMRTAYNTSPYGYRQTYRAGWNRVNRENIFVIGRKWLSTTATSTLYCKFDAQIIGGSGNARLTIMKLSDSSVLNGSAVGIVAGINTVAISTMPASLALDTEYVAYLEVSLANPSTIDINTMTFYST